MKIIKNNIINQKIKNLNIFSKVRSGYAFSGDDFISEGVKVLKIKNVRFGYIDYDDVSFVAIEMANSKKQFLTKSGDILISMTGSGPNAPNSLVGRVGRVKIGEETSLLNQRVCALDINKNEIDESFLFHFLSQKSTQMFLLRNSTGTASQRNISPETIGLIGIPIFPLDQQRKIGNALSQQEDQVNKIKSLIEKLEKRNQYYAERLLSGELRVREGDDGNVEFYENENWKEIFINGKKKKVPNDAYITTLRKEYKDSYTKGSEGLSNYLEIGDIDIKTKEYNLKEKEKLSVSSCKIVPYSTLLISTVRPTRRCFTVTKEELPVSSAFVRFNTGKDSYPLHIINTMDFSSFCERNAEGGTYPVIKSYNVEGYQYYILPEKNKISEILDLLILEKTNLVSLLEKEQKRFDWMSDALLSGEYQIVD